MIKMTRINTVEVGIIVLNPVISAILMSLSTIIVAINAILLKNI
jgi:cation transport ATPase